MRKKKRRVVEIDTDLDATFMDSILTEKDIPHLMVSYATRPFTNLFQFQRGWGHISAPLELLEEIAEIYEEFKQSRVE